MYMTIEELKKDFNISIYDNEITLLEFKDKDTEIFIPKKIEDKKLKKRRRRET